VSAEDAGRNSLEGFRGKRASSYVQELRGSGLDRLEKIDSEVKSVYFEIYRTHCGLERMSLPKL